ncbi:hypothetical protein [Luedemannella helvata]|uniref:Uncharacterized protein n=1 Tax=Luedemannella helvata TaxID=349315 RepID=A0ABP4WHB0_9ACTN
MTYPPQGPADDPYEPPTNITPPAPPAGDYPPPPPGYGPPPSQPPGYAAPPPAPPPGYAAPPPGYAAPPPGYAAPPPASSYAVPSGYQSVGDPLVPAGPDFSTWFAKLQEVAKRSWKSALIITGLGIALPQAVIAILQQFAIGAWTFSVLEIGDLGTALGSLIGGLFVLLLAYVGVAFVASIAWAAGTWALVQEAATGQSANIGAAFKFGTSRAMRLWPWAIVAGIAFGIGSACCYLPGVYAAFAFSMFGFVGLFQRGVNPVGGSFQMTHSDFGPNLGKILLTFVPFVIFGYVIPFVFGLLAAAVAGAFSYGFTYDLTFGLVAAFGQLIAAPGYAALLLGLLPTYAQLRARQAPVSTPLFQQELQS